MLDSAKARGCRQDENPARWRGHLAQILERASRVASPRALAILKSLQPLGSEHLFPSGKLSDMAMRMLMRRMKVDASVHGFRSGFRDWAAECTGHAHEVAEMALAHTIENKVERAYRRGDLFDKRRRLMDDWATYCASDGAAAAKVTPMRRTAA